MAFGESDILYDNTRKLHSGTANLFILEMVFAENVFIVEPLFFDDSLLLKS